jgi:hypothetical protein
MTTTLPDSSRVPVAETTILASLPGYTPVEGRAPLTAGCSATLTLTLKKPASTRR